MRKIIEDQTTGDDLNELLGETVMVWCMNYIYSGTLTGVSDTTLLLNPASVVYETGPFDGNLKDAQKLRNPAYISRASVEMVTKL